LNGGKGHTAPVTSFAKILAGPQQELHIASGGADNEVKLWKINGEFSHSITHAACVTALCPFQDALGGKFLLFLNVFLLFLF
jgi:WD40 repeat protein